MDSDAENIVFENARDDNNDKISRHPQLPSAMLKLKPARLAVYYAPGNGFRHQKHVAALYLMCGRPPEHIYVNRPLHSPIELALRLRAFATRVKATAPDADGGSRWTLILGPFACALSEEDAIVHLNQNVAQSEVDALGLGNLLGKSYTPQVDRRDGNGTRKCQHLQANGSQDCWAQRSRPLSCAWPKGKRAFRTSWVL